MLKVSHGDSAMSTKAVKLTCQVANWVSYLNSPNCNHSLIRHLRKEARPDGIDRLGKVVIMPIEREKFLRRKKGKRPATELGSVANATLRSTSFTW